MPAINVNQYPYKAIPVFLVLIVASLCMILPDVPGETYSPSVGISIETETSENDDAGKCTQSFPFRLSTHPCDKQQVSLLDAVDSINNFLHYREPVRAPPSTIPCQ